MLYFEKSSDFRDIKNYIRERLKKKEGEKLTSTGNMGTTYFFFFAHTLHSVHDTVHTRYSFPDLRFHYLSFVFRVGKRLG